MQMKKQSKGFKPLLTGRASASSAACCFFWRIITSARAKSATPRTTMMEPSRKFKGGRSRVAVRASFSTVGSFHFSFREFFRVRAGPEEYPRASAIYLACAIEGNIKILGIDVVHDNFELTLAPE